MSNWNHELVDPMIEHPLGPEPGKRRLLLVDDDPLIRQLVIRALKADYLIDEAASGLEALAKVQLHPPDLVLLDLMMPGMDGYEVCQALRQNSTTATVPIIMLTALDQVDSKVQGFRTGADDYITKPFDLQELRTRVETHLRRSARDQSASPLTGLPGNRTIEQTLAARIKTGDPMAVLYIDLTNFKAYNDVYGWLKGDQVIRLLATTLTAVVGEFGGASDFVGHVGGDDFVVISTPQSAATIAQQVINRFDAGIPEFYNEETRTRGYSVVKDRRGRLYHAPLATVAIAIVTDAHREFEHPTEIAEMAAEVKQYVKSRQGSHYAFDRRTK